jgi:hypothetical protein
VRNGVLHNPKSDRRTTEGVFHIAEGGLPIPPDKKAVPKLTFAKLLEAALNPPVELLEIPFTAGENDKAYTFVSVLLRPIVRPEIPGYCEERSMEVRFFAPGSLVANVDFVESIFGNSGDPFIPENDASIDPVHWTGTTGCIILATHLTELTKKESDCRTGTRRRRRHAARACVARTHRNIQRRAGLSRSLRARRVGRPSSPNHCGQLFGYSKKGGQIPHISYFANLARPRRGRARGRRPGLSLLQPRHALCARADTNLNQGTQPSDVFTIMRAASR